MGSTGSRDINLLTDEQLQQEISNLPKLKRGYSQNPLPMVDSSLEVEIRSILGSTNMFDVIREMGESKTIPIDKMKTIQDYVVPYTLSGIAKYKYPDRLGEPIVLQYNGTYIIIDGNHRAAVQKLRGVKKMAVTIIDVNEFERRKS